STKAPKGTGNVLAVLTNYTSGWQLQLNNLEGLEGFTPWTDEPEPELDPVGSLDVNFDNGQIPDGWGNIQIEGDKAWYTPSFNNNYYAAMTGYKGTAPFDSWLVTQPLDASLMSAKTLTFETQVNGYGSTTTSLEVYILDNADPAKANKTKLNPTLAEAPASGYSSWAQSGTISLADAKGKFYIGWRYKATTDANYATWCVDNIKVQ
ncbi:MAG: choice-of-anchor J domain-containing protein, partial [Muribaculaceae bacterium]|nr:choice-of-anchor J domain-containing protein [Muribaculaceae bacterium]